MSLLSIVQESASQLGLRQPDSVVGSSELTAQLLFRFAKQGLRELSRYHEWQNLIVERTHTSVAQVEQTGALPNDFDRLVYNAEIWNRTDNQRLTGPTPQRVWQKLQNGVSGGVAGWWRIMGNELHIFPAMSAGKTIAFEYVSKHLVEDSEGDTKETFTADTDVARLPEDLIVLEVVWRYRHSRGFAQYAEDLATCEREKEMVASRDRGTGRMRPYSPINESAWPPSPFWPGTIES